MTGLAHNIISAIQSNSLKGYKFTCDTIKTGKNC